MNKLLHIVVAAAAAAAILAAPNTALTDDRKSILVTGASTGIGRNLAETLAENGYHVYAGARKDKDLAALDAIDNITAVRLDVTKQDQVDAVVEMIEDEGTGLYGLVNNAGVVRVQLNPGIENYTGSERNQVRSTDFPQTQRSIRFVLDEFAKVLSPVQRDYAPRLKWDTKFTSTGLANMKLVGQQFLFHCPAAPTSLPGRRVYGTDRYAFNSYVCLAAVHAGRLTAEGGYVTVQMQAPEGKLKGSIRNDIESKDGPAGTRQLVFPVKNPPVAAAQ